MKQADDADGNRLVTIKYLIPLFIGAAGRYDRSPWFDSAGIAACTDISFSVRFDSGFEKDFKRFQ